VAECKDIDRALADLGNKINEQNKIINNLQKRQDDCCNKGNKQDQNKPTDLTPIYQRLSKIENYINVLDGDLTGITGIIKEINTHLEPLFKLLDELGSIVGKGIENVMKIFN
jgi:archaellum component FlaC